MTSVPSYIKQIPTDARNFIPVSSLAYAGGINAYNEVTNTFTTAGWAGSGGPAQGSLYTSSINGPGAGKLRDMGKTVVSSGRAFRKVQLIVPVSTTNTSTFGVQGNSSAQQPTYPYLTGYIELGWEGQNSGAPVARTM